MGLVFCCPLEGVREVNCCWELLAERLPFGCFSCSSRFIISPSAVPTVEERGRRLLAPLSAILISGTSSVGAGDERVVGLACPDEEGVSWEKVYVFFIRAKHITFHITHFNLQKIK